MEHQQWEGFNPQNPSLAHGLDFDHYYLLSVQIIESTFLSKTAINVVIKDLPCVHEALSFTKAKQKSTPERAATHSLWYSIR